MKCTNHEETDAAGICMYCGKPFCKECLVEIKGKMYCRNDLDKVFDENKNSSQTQIPQININNTNTINNGQNPVPSTVQKRKSIALILCLFLGFLGAHRFYTGKTGTGLVYFLTCGLLGIGIVIDLLLIASGSFRDKSGYPLV